MYDDDDDVAMTSMARLVHRLKDRRLLFPFFPLSSSLLFFFFSICFSYFSSSLFVWLDDVSQCVDMKKQDDAATITTAVVVTAVASQLFRGLINRTT